MFGCITPKQTLTETSLLRRYTRSMRKRRRGKYAGRVMGIEQGTVTPLVFTTTGGMANECVKYHTKLAEVIANKKWESYSSVIFWIRTSVFRHRTLCDAMLKRRRSFKMSWMKMPGHKKIALDNLKTRKSTSRRILTGILSKNSELKPNLSSKGSREWSSRSRINMSNIKDCQCNSSPMIGNQIVIGNR